MENDLIETFVDEQSRKALERLVQTQDDDEAVTAAIGVAGAFGAAKPFGDIADDSTDAEQKLVMSFKNNLLLLIQKTWIEKSDEALKAEVLYHLGEFRAFLEARQYARAYSLFFSIVDNAVYLMFGAQTKTKEFLQYALRIDPEFGIFWWYIQSLPREAAWSEQKSRIAVLLGMYFLANY